MIPVKNGEISERLFELYLYNLVGRFFKILPLRDDECDSLATYMESLELELIGQKDLVVALNDDSRFLNLINILHVFVQNPALPSAVYKREVMRAINLCKTLYQIHTGKEWRKHG